MVMYSNIHYINTKKAMIIKRLVIITALFFTLTAVAQTDEERSSMARDMLDKMSTKSKSYQTIKAKFTLTVDNRQADKKTDFDGQMDVKGDKYVLDMMNQVTYFDGKDLYVWQKEVGEVNISESEEGEESMMSPMKLFGAYEEGYKMRYIGDVSIDGVLCNEVDLFPEDRTKNISRIRLTMDKKTNMIKCLMQQGKDGTSYYVKIKDFKTNEPMADTHFVFDAKANPKVEIIDLR